MECTLATLIACFNLSGFYIDSGLMYLDSGVQEQTIEHTNWTIINGTDYATDRKTEVIAHHSARNPYGRLSLGYEVNLNSVSFRLEAGHWSSLSTTRDRGINAVSLSARWHPFARR
jgi:hypothetical protein